ncbi:hypothetical protein ONE63_011554 [Megalurothrips usitatus]|uniref:DNA-directed DNA polymerase n=1 Tax=Megalurothrips usitatus TaxID=439358 RepID=A0AAV7X2R3_9NEOP|nr:hypothetical protein ONE63_011554 [Megalurothrips usitatus]
MLEVLRWTPDVICVGRKILQMTAEHLIFKDSVNWLQMPLKRFSATFELPEEKGSFPHFFNDGSAERWAYEGPLPDVHYYGPDSMSEAEHSRFIKWHADLRAQNYVFNFRREIVDYCKRDVVLLRKGCLAFRRDCIEETSVDPLRETPTLASLALLAYRRNFLEPDTIGIYPPQGYRAADVQSGEALEWLAYTEETLNGERLQAGLPPVQIVHAERGREVRRLNYKVDGFAVIDGVPTCFEYNGYVWLPMHCH